MNILNLTDKAIIESITNRFEPYSDYNFVSLYSWDVEQSLRWKVDDGNLILKFKTYSGSDHFYTFLGDSNPVKTATELLSRAKAEGIHQELNLIPEVVIQEADLEAKLNIELDESNADYILDIAEQVALRGNKFSSKRYNINKFTRNYPDTHVEVLDLSSPSVQEQILQLFDQWATYKEVASLSKTINERQAVQRIFDLVGYSDLIGFGVFIEQKLSCMLICETLPNGYVMAHFQKALSNHSGIFSYSLHQACVYFHELGYSWMNIEQDMGEAGLALSKHLYRPAKLLNKFTIKTLT